MNPIEKEFFKTFTRHNVYDWLNKTSFRTTISMLHAYTKKNRMVFLIKRVRYTLRQSAVLTLTLLNGVRYRTTGVAYTLAARSF